MKPQLSPWLWTTFGLAALALPLQAQTEWEWEPDEGYHEEEWYDPADWFNEDQYTSYEDDWYDYGYDDDYYDDYYGWGYYEPYYDPYTVADFDPWYEYDYDYDDWYYDDGYDYVYLDDDDWVWDQQNDEWVMWSQYRQQLDQQGQRQSGQQQRGQGQMAQQQRGQQQRGQQQRGQMAQQQRGQRQSGQMGQQRGQRQSGQMGQQRGQRQSGQMGQRQRGQQQGSQMMTVSGQLDGVTEVNLKGQQQKHTVVRLRMQDGTTKLVNLGPNTSADKFNLEQGQQVTVRGRKGQINQTPVLMATMVKSGDQTMRRSGQQQRGQQAQRDRRNQQGQRDQMARGQGGQRQYDRSVRGQIEDWRKLSTDLEGDRSEHLFIRLRLQDGNSMIANFGPNIDMERLDLDNGDKIVIRGRTRTVNGQDVLFARDVRLEHEPVSLDWARDRTNQQQGGQPAGPGR